MPQSQSHSHSHSHSSQSPGRSTQALQLELQSTYPWTKTPLIASAPMLNIAMPSLAVSVSSAGGLGFLAAGFDVSSLEKNLEEAVRLVKVNSDSTNSATILRQFYAETGILPIGIGFINWGADISASIRAIEKYKPCAVWFFGPASFPADLIPWMEQVRRVTSGKTRVWVQIGCVAEAVSVVDNIVIDGNESVQPDVLVVQGSDAGGHGLARSASVISLVPEVCDVLGEKEKEEEEEERRARRKQTRHVAVLAAGGIVDGRGLAACLALGASGVVMGTRFLASREASIAPGYQAEILRASDGGSNTVRSTVYDRVRGIGGWPDRYDGRGVINKSYLDAVENAMADDKNMQLYKEELKKGDLGWGPQGRLTTYAGTGVGLVRDTLSAADIVEGALTEFRKIQSSLMNR